ncbi:MAG TPA: glycosyltransferase family 4 protein [Candidatus Acidoferrales bacterium]|nr:glycosyltransferase family 4 protein [Candidatus Acidoferrales bacterium]
MRILIYSRFFPPSIGGVETYARLLAEGLARKPDGTPEVFCVTEIAAGDFDDSTLPFTVVRKPGILGLFRLIREADVVHIAGPAILPLAIAIWLHKPVIVEHHAYQAVCPNGLLLYSPTRTACPDCFMRRRYLQCLQCNSKEAGWLGSLKMLVFEWPRRWLCRLATAQLCITQHVANRVRLPRSTVIYYGVPDVANTREVVQSFSQQKIVAPTLTVGYVGRLVQEKDVQTLIEAVQQVRDKGHSIGLKLIGDGPERSSLESIAAKNGTSQHIVFVGALRGEDLNRAALDLDVLVLPSLWEEPAGLVVMEQMMRGRPVIVTNNGGAAELAGDTGLTFPPGDRNALAQCLRRFLEEPALLAKLSRLARARAVELFSLPNMVENHYNLFELCLHQRGEKTEPAK